MSAAASTPRRPISVHRGERDQATALQSTSTKGSLGRAFAVVICTEDFDRPGFCPYVLHEISVHDEPDLGCLRYSLTDVPPQSNSRSGSVRRVGDGRPSRPTPQEVDRAARLRAFIAYRFLRR